MTRDFNMDRQYREPYFERIDQVVIMLMGLYVAGSLWTSFLCLRTIVRIKKMGSAPVIFDGEIDANDFEKLKMNTKSVTYNTVLEEFVDLSVKIFQVISNYYPYIWSLTADFTKSLFYRAVWFSAIDKILIQSAFIPAVFFNALYHRRDPFLAVLNGMYDTIYSAAMTAIWAFILVYMFELIQPPGVVMLMVLHDISGMVLLGVFMKFLENHILRPLPHDDVGIAIERMANIVGYPVSQIYLDDMTAEPETIYYTSLWHNMVTITPRLISVLDPNQAAAVVAHELGKWRYSHNVYHCFFHFLCLLLKCCLLVATYDSARVRQLFRVDPTAHAFISHHLAFHFFWAPSYKVARGVYNVFKAVGVFLRDDYSCEVWQPKSLKEALIKLSLWNHLYFPLLDHWHSAWSNGCPTSVQRISRIMRKHGVNPSSSNAVER